MNFCVIGAGGAGAIHARNLSKRIRRIEPGKTMAAAFDVAIGGEAMKVVLVCRSEP